MPRLGKMTRPIPYKKIDFKLFIKNTIPMTGGCLFWISSDMGGGYGAFRHGRRMFLAHRVSWAVFNQADPKDGYVCHKCDQPKCVNPKHLYLGDAATNARDTCRRGRVPLGEDRPASKLTEKKVRAIRKEIFSRTSNSIRAAAKRYGVSSSTLQRVVSGESWKHVV